MSSRANSTVLFIILASGALLMGAISVTALLSLAHELSAGSPRIIWRPSVAVCFPITFAALALAVLCVMPAPRPAGGRGREKAATRPIGWVQVLLAATVAGLVLSMLAPAISTALVSQAAAKRGFAPCPPLSYERPRHLRWTRITPSAPLVRCPRDWHEAF